MNVLVNGASMSRGPGSWPYYLQPLLNCKLVNLGLAGCGYTYVHESTISEMGLRNYDLVLIMWPESGRLDVRVDNINQFIDSTNTSYYESKQNDWPEKINYPINDQDYVEKNWIFGKRPNHGNTDSVSEVFVPRHTITKYQQILQTEYIQLISLQSVLKSMKIPYQFMFWQPFKKFNRYNHLYNLMDWNNIYTDICLETISKEHNWITEDQIHPSPEAHQLYAQLLATRLKTIIADKQGQSH